MSTYPDLIAIATPALKCVSDLLLVEIRRSRIDVLVPRIQSLNDCILDFSGFGLPSPEADLTKPCEFNVNFILLKGCVICTRTAGIFLLGFLDWGSGNVTSFAEVVVII
jgi:hypothetical protein